jgi:hypothetical protein
VSIRRAREDGASWARIGEALGLADVAAQRGISLGWAAWEYAADATAYLPGQFRAFAWTCLECGEAIEDRGPSGRSPAEDEHGHGEACQRLAADVAGWVAQAG